MSTIAEVAEGLRAALRTVKGLRVYGDPGSLTDPPAAVLGPPTLRWESYDSGPSAATYTVYLVVPQNERAMDRLWDFMKPVAEAIDTVTDAVVRAAQPGVFSAGGTDLPCYELQVEVALF